MSAESDGIFVRYRVIFITVIVSICINIFFLLMGILIGKDDLAWEDQQTTQAPPPVETRLREPKTIEDERAPLEQVERELSNFEEPPDSSDPVTSPEEPLITRGEETPPPGDEQSVATGSNQVPEKKEAPVKEPPSKVQPETVTTSSNSETFWIQLSATNDKAKATAFRDEVKKSGYPAVILEEGGMYKVQVGPFNSREKAESDRKKINAAFKISAWVRTR